MASPLCSDCTEMETFKYTTHVLHMIATCFDSLNVVVIRPHTELQKATYLHISYRQDIGP